MANSGTGQSYSGALSLMFGYTTQKFISTDHNTSCHINIPVSVVAPAHMTTQTSMSIPPDGEFNYHSLYSTQLYPYEVAS